MPQITVKSPTGPPVTYTFDRDVITIGRGAGNDLVIMDPTLSRRHAEIRKDGRRWALHDCGSHNGVLLNRRPVNTSEPLSAGDEITLGWTVLVFAEFAPRAVRPEGEAQADHQTWSARGDSVEDDEPVLVGASAAIKEILATIEKVAASPTTILVTGDTGTGKELVARRIHLRSRRAVRPFVTVNCPAMPESLFEAELFGVEKGVATGVSPRPGRFESANDGTLFFDEIGDLAVAAQAKILRFLEEKTIEKIGGRQLIELDVRVLAATNHNLEKDVARGAFRADLYQRLNVVTIHIPPLKERPEDIPLLVKHFLQGYKSSRITVSREAMDLLALYEYPGNVRELRHILERLRLLKEEGAIRPEDLPLKVRTHAAAQAGAPPAPSDRAGLLYERIVREGESFWDAVKGPFLSREISREVVTLLLARAHHETGGSYRKMSKLLRADPDYKKFLNFISNHKLRVRG